MHKLTKQIIQDLYGEEAAAVPANKSDIYLALIKGAVMGDDVACICKACKTVYDGGFEPDSREGYCDECEEQKVVSILVLEGMI